ncbi:MAG: PD-(D/E)XK nuclease domain-containing protein [Deltaproteobacteria bacterium]|jgi:hypothetical protein|nr:PD-(D/E)XK nuclease domain-containing protein [Deltaproteobacteria bacterium]
MFQTGYLTIDRVDNTNVGQKISFFSNLLSLDISLENPLALKIKSEAIVQAFANKSALDLETSFHQFLAMVHNKLHIPLESFYQTSLMFVMALVDHSVKIEDPTGDGYIDMVLEISKTDIFIIEMKYIKIDNMVNNVKSTQTKIKKSSYKPEDQSQIQANRDAAIRRLMNLKAIEALKQIDEKNYVSKYLGLGKNVNKVSLVIYDKTKIYALFNKNKI